MPDLTKAQKRGKARAGVEAKRQGGILWTRAAPKNRDILLQPFDEDVLNAIEGKEHMFVREKEGTFYTITKDGTKVGITGFIHGSKKQPPFLTIGIIKKFRGKGFLGRAYKELARKHGFKRVYVDIEKRNKESIKAHEETGFKASTDDAGKRQFKTDVRMSKD